MSQPHPFPFFVGSGRSGTTLVKAIFDSHSTMAIPGESGFVVRFGRLPRRRRYETPGGFEIENFVGDLLEHRGFSRWGLTEGEIRAALASAPIEGYAQAVRRLYDAHARGQGKSRYGDKTPNYVLSMPLLGELFPEARFVHIIRDGRDVALSHLDIEEWGPASLEEAALDWKRHVAQGLNDGRRLGPARYREMRYEALVGDPEKTVQDLCVFLDLAYEEGMLHYFERATDLLKPEHHPHNHRHLHAPPSRGLRDWRNQMPAQQVMLFEALAGDLLEELGYERATVAPSRRARLVAGSRVLTLRAGKAFGRARTLPGKLTDRRRRTALVRSVMDQGRRLGRSVPREGSSDGQP